MSWENLLESRRRAGEDVSEPVYQARLKQVWNTRDERITGFKGIPSALPGECAICYRESDHDNIVETYVCVRCKRAAQNGRDYSSIGDSMREAAGDVGPPGPTGVLGSASNYPPLPPQAPHGQFYARIDLSAVEALDVCTPESFLTALRRYFPQAEFHRCGRKLVTDDEATAEKGYPHPGSFIPLPDGGGTIHLQYGHPDEVGRNGCFTTDVIQGLIDNLSVYQQEGHKMACAQTARTLEHLQAALNSINNRAADRVDRGVHQTDEA